MSANTSSSFGANKPAVRMLTDFSIETLIGKEETTTTSRVVKSCEKTKRAAKKYRPKNFQCEVCNMAFSNNGQLKNHLRIHTGERPFVCNFKDCHKTFTRNEELTRHKLIHTGVRPHTCTTCGKRFGRKDHLKKHARTHERKRIRKKVFIRPNVNNFIPDDVFVPPKPAKVNNLTDQSHMIRLQPAPIIMSTATTTALTMQTVLTPPNASPTIFTRPPTTATIQQLASDYWNKWYNLIGFYQQQNQHHYLTDSLSGLMRRS